MKWLFFVFALITFSANAQWKSYKLTPKNDTINRIDQNDKRQGRWVVKVEGLRGEPGYDEEGIYKDGKKEGVWRAYTSMGDLYAVEQFRWGNRDGKCQYFNIAGLEREESWKAVNPENPFDTVDVYDPVDPTKVEQKVVKIEGTSVKHGLWKWYESGSGSLVKSENYFLGKVQVPEAPKPATETVTDAAEAKPVKAPAKVKPREVMEFEKKKRKIRSGETGL